MAKNYVTLYNTGNDSISLEQRWYLKEETTRGSIIAPTGTDFLFVMPGGSIAYEQPFESNPSRSGRHHNSIIKKKKTTSWSFSTFLNLDEGVAQGATEIDLAKRLLWKSLLGEEDLTVGGVFAEYDSNAAPDLTFTLMEVSDQWARQSPGAFVQSGNFQLPGDGEATVEWAGAAKTTFFAGIGKSTTDNNTGNTVTLQTGEGDRFGVGALVMIIEADGTTRSADTPDGSPRTITAISGDVITVDGAVLADADGSAADIYLVYYEPETPTAIDNPIVGLVGSVSVVGLADQCIRNLGININNNHELQDYCYGEDALAGNIFVPGSRMTAEIAMSLNMNHDVLELMNKVQAFEAQDITAILGDSTGRHYKALLPRVFFNVPAFAVPDEGSIPVEFSGTAYQTAFDAADEVKIQVL